MVIEEWPKKPWLPSGVKRAAGRTSSGAMRNIRRAKRMSLKPVVRRGSVDFGEEVSRAVGVDDNYTKSWSPSGVVVLVGFIVFLAGSGLAFSRIGVPDLTTILIVGAVLLIWAVVRMVFRKISQFFHATNRFLKG